MENQIQQNPGFFGRIFSSVKSLPSRIGSLFNKHKENEGYNYRPYDFAPQDMPGYNPYNEYQTNPYAQPMQEIQEPLTMAKAREMSRTAGRRRHTDNIDGAQPLFNDFQENRSMEIAQPFFEQPNDNSYQPYPQMDYAPIQPQYPTMQGNFMPGQYPSMQGNRMQEPYPAMQENIPNGFHVERNPLLDTNIAVFMLLKPEDCHDMLKGIVNPSLYIINMENMLDDSSVSYCKHVLMGAKLVLNYAIHRISSKNIYILCPKQINIKMDDVARNLITRFERETRSYNREGMGIDMNKRHEFGF